MYSSMTVGSRGEDAVRLVAAKNDAGSKICGPKGVVVDAIVVAATAVDVNAGVRAITEYTRRRDMRALRGDDGIGLNSGERNRGRQKSSEYTYGDVPYFYTLSDYVRARSPAMSRWTVRDQGAQIELEKAMTGSCSLKRYYY